MIKRILILLIVFALFPLFGNTWGFFAHRLINENAIYGLPPPLISFYKSYLRHLEQEAVSPDKRCYVDTLEPPKHYIDLDDWDLDEGESLMISWDKAVERHSEFKLRKYGIIPWQIEKTYRQLSDAMSDMDIDRILRSAADLGHYIGDAHVPLHTTKNYNGQLTNQRGIHALWETRLPERFANNYRLWAGKANYIASIRDSAWLMITESHALVDTVLLLERKLSEQFGDSRKYGMIYRNRQWIRTYSNEFLEKYHEALNGMVEYRLKTSIKRVSDAWYSAWIDAGKPDLTKLISTKKPMLSIDTIWTRQVRRFGREEWH